MKIIPIAFCLDDKWELPAGVCLTSLLENANTETFYDIFIISSGGDRIHNSLKLKSLESYYPNCRINFRAAGNVFENSYSVRGINYTTYYRLLIPLLIPEYDKIMYHDVDVIFRSDLAVFFEQTDMGDNYFAGVLCPGVLNNEFRVRRQKSGFDQVNYILAGDMIINSKSLRENRVVDLFKKEVEDSEYEFQDMDIINKVCKGHLLSVPPFFCGTDEIFRIAANNIEQSLYSQSELAEMVEYGIIHYNGVKPWEAYCINFDIWWEYYRKSIYYDRKYYFDFFNSRMNYLDELSLFKRIKVLFRFFKTGGSLK